MFNVFRISDLAVIRKFEKLEDAKYFLNCLKDKEDYDIAEVGKFKTNKNRNIEIEEKE